MIVIGTYADIFEQNTDMPLKYLYSLLYEFVPKEIALHILPIHPSSGDSGFAPDDWFSIDEKIGDIDDVKKISTRWKLILDCIYNHIGINHFLAKNFLKEPNKFSKYFYAYKSNVMIESPQSPRGGNVLKPHRINGENWLLWQTFHKYSFDINLENDEIIQMINSHLDFLIKLGIYGVRLDGAAYYAKVITDKVARHSKKAHVLTRNMYERVIKKDLDVCVQLDCDIDGEKYLPLNLNYNVPIVDYSHSALMIYSILSGDLVPLKEHLSKFGNKNLVRCLRTHDGILFRSKNLSHKVVDYLTAFADTNNIPIRNINESPYELNCSIPFLFSLNSSKKQAFTRIKLCLATSTILNGWNYIYLPLLFNYTPENYHNYTNDPRILNRSRIDKNTIRYIIDNRIFSELNKFLNGLLKVDKLLIKNIEIIVQSNSLLIIDSIDNRIKFVGNFSHRKMVFSLKEKEFIYAEEISLETNIINPYGFCFYKY